MRRSLALVVVLVLAATKAVLAQQAETLGPEAEEIRAALQQLDHLVAETDAAIVRQLDAAEAADDPKERVAWERIADRLSDQLDVLEESRARMATVLEGIENEQGVGE